MPTYWLPVTDDQFLRLEMARVPNFAFSIGVDRGVVFNNETNLQSGLAALGLREDTDQRARTEYDGILRVTIQGAGRPLRPPAGGGAPAPVFEPNQQVVIPNLLEVAHWNGRNQNAFLQKIQQYILPVLNGKKIVLHAPHGTALETPPVNDGCFHFWFWASPHNNGMAVPATLWGIGVDARNEGYRPSGIGTAIIDSGGWAVGELVGDNFYIHWDCCETGSRGELDIFGNMMEALALAIEYPGKTPAQIAALKANSVIFAQRRSYINACGKRMGDFLAQAQATFNAKGVQIESLQEQLAQAIREQDFVREQLTGLEGGNNQATIRFGAEFDRLLATEGVCDVEIEGDKLRVYTDILFCRDSEGHNHRIGEFIITIPLNGHGTVHWANQTERKDNHDAPHIQNGKPCLGNMGDVFPQLIGKFEFAALTTMAINFVQSVNDTRDVWGQTIRQWPVVRHNDAVRPAEKRQRRTPVPIPPDTATPAVAAQPETPAMPAMPAVPPVSGITQSEIESLLATLTVGTAEPTTGIPVTVDTEDDFDPDDDRD